MNKSSRHIAACSLHMFFTCRQLGTSHVPGRLQQDGRQGMLLRAATEPSSSILSETARQCNEPHKAGKTQGQCNEPQKAGKTERQCNHSSGLAMQCVPQCEEPQKG